MVAAGKGWWVTQVLGLVVFQVVVLVRLLLGSRVIVWDRGRVEGTGFEFRLRGQGREVVSGLGE